MSAISKPPYCHRPLVGVALALSLGIWIQEYLVIPFFIPVLLTLVFVFLFYVTRRRQWPTVIFLLGAFVGIGMVYTTAYQRMPQDHIDHVARYYRKSPVFVEGIVVSDVEKREFLNRKKTTFVMRVHRLKTPWGWKEKSGRVLVNIFRHADVAYGDDVVLEGKLHLPFEFSPDDKLSYIDYLERSGIQWILSVKKAGRVEVTGSGRGHPIKAASLKIKHKLDAILIKTLTRNEAGLMQALLLGDRYNIPASIEELFQYSGVVHILAISGFNISIVAGMIFLFLKLLPLPRKGQYLLTIGLVILYAFMTGGRPSVVRAAIMATVFLAGFVVERETETRNNLALAAMLILLMNPSNLFDVGFQLSFVSVFAIISLYPRLMGICDHWVPENKSRLLRYIFQSLAVSLAASLGVTGLIAYYFHIVTPIALWTNLLVIPLVSVITALGLGLLLMGAVLPATAFMFAACIKVLLNLMVGVVFLSVQIPGAYILFSDMPLWPVGIYYGLFFMMVFLQKTPRRNMERFEVHV